MAALKKIPLVATGPISHDGELYGDGDALEIDEMQARSLVASGSAVTKATYEERQLAAKAGEKADAAAEKAEKERAAAEQAAQEAEARARAEAEAAANLAAGGDAGAAQKAGTKGNKG